MEQKRSEKRTATRLLEESRKAYADGDFAHTRMLAAEAAHTSSDTPVGVEASRLLEFFKTDSYEVAGGAFFLLLYALAWYFGLSSTGL